MPEAELVADSLRVLASPRLCTLRMPTRFYCPPGDRLQQGVRAFRIPFPRTGREGKNCLPLVRQILSYSSAAILGKLGLSGRIKEELIHKVGTVEMLWDVKVTA